MDYGCRHTDTGTPRRPESLVGRWSVDCAVYHDDLGISPASLPKLRRRFAAPNGRIFGMDFADIEKAFRPLHEQLDHRLLNEVEGLENPTSENIAIWIWQRLSDRLGGLSRIVVAEAPESICVYAGPDSEGQSDGRE